MHLKRIINIFLVVFFLLLTFLAFGYFSLRHSLPQKSGTISFSFLQSPVQVYRDAWGVPHIVAQNQQDLFAALGYVTAQDRLWQMDIQRRAANGRLAEIIGREMLEADKLACTIDFKGVAQRILEQMSSESRLLLKAYARGVNEFIRTHPKKLPIEFSVLRYKPEPWREVDSIVISRFLGLLLSMGWHTDLAYGKIFAKIDRDLFRQIIPFQSSRILLSAVDDLLDQLPESSVSRLRLPFSGLGSNCWAISGERTRSGLPLLANDTHLLFTSPNIYYIVHLVTPQLNAIGLSIPGSPGIVIGRNEKIAWGFTNGMIDDVDFFVEKLDAERTHYIYRQKAYPLDIREEIIPVKNDEPFKLTTRFTRNGPIINGILSAADTTDPPISLRWAGFDVSNEFLACRKLLTARNWDDFREAVSTFKNPGQNIIYADVHGNIGYQLAAAVPIRRNKYGLLPADGTTGRNDWLGYLAFDDLPRIFNPSSNILVSANNPIKSDGYYLSAYWEPGYRAQRIKALLQDLSAANVDSFARIQQDVFSPQAKAVLPEILTALRSEGFDKTDAFVLLSSWDYQETTMSMATLIFEKLYWTLFENTFRDELGDTLFTEFRAMPHLNAEVLDRLIIKGQSRWFDDVTTKDVTESFADIVKKSFIATIDSLTRQLGPNPGQWRWGDVHTVTFAHPFGLRRAFARFFNVGPFKSAGGNFTINNSTFLPGESFKAVFGPCMRQIVDLSDEKSYYIVLTTGQSGHPFSAHYQDQTKLWQRGELIRLTLDTSNMDERYPYRLTFVPSDHSR